MPGEVGSKGAAELLQGCLILELPHGGEKEPEGLNMDERTAS